MTGPEALPFSTTVYMDQRDITPWCSDVSWGQPDRFLEQEFEITTEAWHLFDDTARYDIYASYDPATPRAECVIRKGWVLPDRRRTVKVTRGEPPQVIIKGKSWSSISFRRAPAETLVLVPVHGTAGSNINYARRVLAKHDGPVGKWRCVWGISRLDSAVVRLGHMAWFRVSFCMPTHPMGPIIIPPGKSYWQAMLDLTEPYAPEIYYSEFGNSLVFADSVSRNYGRQPLTIGGNMVERIGAVPVKTKRARRCIVRVPAWH